MMAESVSDLESDASSVESAPTDARIPLSAALLQQLNKRLESLQQENRVLRMELDTYRYKCKSLEEENRELKKARVTIVRHVVLILRVTNYNPNFCKMLRLVLGMCSLCTTLLTLNYE